MRGRLRGAQRATRSHSMAGCSSTVYSAGMWNTNTLLAAPSTVLLAEGRCPAVTGFTGQLISATSQHGRHALLMHGRTRT